MPAFSLYKARNVPTKSPCCAICVDRTRGRTQRVSFGYGVAAWLCVDHSSVDFLTRSSGRDLVVTLSGVWQAAGGMTASQHKAMMAHLAALKVRPAKPLPGSYAWPEVRARAEQLFAAGHQLAPVDRALRAADYGVAEPPSPRTVRRWRSQRRWLARGPRGPRPP